MLLNPDRFNRNLPAGCRCRSICAGWLTAALLGLTGCNVSPVKQVISTTNAPAAIGPYSQAIKVGSLLFLSGQIAIDPKTNQMSTASIEEQTQQVLQNLSAVLEADGMNLTNVVNTTVYLTDISDFAKMNGVYATFFKDLPPARATVQVARLPRDARVETAAIAIK
jgi:2-iminobutanoate/2-iminopropanoate deaminase